MCNTFDFSVYPIVKNCNAIRLREIQANIIGDHAIFNNVHQVSQSTLAHILKRHQGKMKQHYLYCICILYKSDAADD